MKKQHLLKSMFCLLLGLVCNATWAQTYSVSLQTEKPVDGYYLIYSESSTGKGWVYYDASLDRKFRVDEDVDYSKEVPTEAAHLWRLKNGSNNTFTLQNKASGVYMPADAQRNQNMTGTETSNFAIEEVPGMDAAWYISQTNYANGSNTLYIHTNAPGGDPNLSYWDSKSIDGTSIRIQFYKVDVPEDSPEDLEAAKTTAKASVASNESKLKDALGYYAYIIDGVKIHTVADVNAAIDATESIDEVSDIANSFTLNIPEVGKYYRIKGISGNYIDAVNCYSGDQMGMRSADTYSFLGTIFLLDEGNRLKNVGTETYVHGTRHIGATKEKANTWTFAASTRTLGCLTLTANGTASHQLHDNAGNRADRCGSICGERHDFTIEEVKAVSLTINAPTEVGASATWNGETKKLPATWSLFEGTSINESTLTIGKYAGYEFDGLFENEASVGNSIEIATLNANRTLTAKFTPAFFSTTYGEKWINIVRKSDANHAMFLGSNEIDAAPTFNKKDYTNTGMMWSFVGTVDNFKIHNYLSGEALALTPSAESIGNGTEVKMVASIDAQAWKLVEKDGGYAIVPINNEGWSLNSYGGTDFLGNPIKFYGANDGGSHWTINLIDTENLLTMGISIDQIWESSPRVAELTFGIDGNTAQTRITENIAAAKYYLPKGVTLSLSSMTYRGYTFNGITGVEDLENFTIPEGGLNMNVSYTANDERTLFYSPRDGHPYRIPAIATAANGDIFAICDYRPCGNDIGYGEVDLVCRVSSDNGVTWSEERTIADGQGDAYAVGDTAKIWQVGFGDPAIVADRESNKVLVMSVCGNQTCWDGTFGEENPNPNRVARLYIEHDGEKWVYGEPEEITYSIYPKFVDKDGNVHAASLFIGAGKICQSRVVKKGDYYRLYCAVWNVTKTQRQHHNYVIYSDDFGQTWEVLGDLGYENSASKWGNEPKCEELPDGTVVLSSRKYNGRYFNLFKFDNDTYTTGTWLGEVGSNEVQGGLSFGGNSTNGEIYKVKAIRNSDEQVCDLMFQSIPTGNDRSNVAIYYKEMEYNEDGTNMYTSTTFAQGWTKGKHVSQKESCYSTMILQADGRIAFFFEEVPGGYCMVYIPYTIEELTGNEYTLYVEENNEGEDNETTSIDQSEIKNQNSGLIYDLMGRRVANPTKGVYIVGGRKVIK